ncbi:MAG: hypothetical protein AB7V04_13210 [Desulfomonilaceae bacterium]
MTKYHLALFYEDNEPHSGKPEGPQQILTGIRELSNNEVRNLRRHVRQIVALNENTNIFKALSLNVRDFENACHEYLERYHLTQEMDWQIMNSIYLDLGRLFLNILNLFRCYLDHTEAILKRKFGKNSKAIGKWEDATHNCYENSFAYRLMYSLRNYGQHVGVPPLDFVLCSERDEPLDDTETSITSNFHVQLRTQPLLENKKIFRKLAGDLSSYGQLIDLRSILEEWFSQVRDLFVTRLGIEICSARNAAQKIVGLRNEVSSQILGAMCILKLPDNHEEDKLSPQMEWIPEHEAQSILQEHRNFFQASCS